MPERLKKRDDADFFHDVDAARLRGPRGLIIALHVVVLLLIAALVVWAYFTDVDESVRGPGRVIPHGETQALHHAEGGVVQEVMVEEGAIVDRDQVIMRIAPEDLQQSLSRRAAERMALEARIARLSAEIEDRALTFPDRLARDAPDLIRRERTSFATRAAEFEASVADLLSEQDAVRDEIETLRGQLEGAQGSLDMVEREIATTRPRVEQNIVPKTSLERLTRESGRLLGEVRALEDRLATVQSRAAALKSTLADRRAQRVTVAARERDRARAELAALAELTRKEQADTQLTILRAPFRGKVVRLPIQTPGARVDPGATVAELTPLGNSLLVEARIDPRHRAMLRPGLNARVRLAAYETVARGGLAGQIESINETPQFDDMTDQLYYRVLVRTAQNVVEADGQSLPVSPGMVAEVDIKTGQRTLLALVVEPFLAARGGN